MSQSKLAKVSNQAELVRELPVSGSGATQKLWRCTPPMKDYDEGTHEYVLTSAVYAMASGPETYIFPSNEAGGIVDMGDLPGSYRGGLRHSLAIEQAGYEVVINIMTLEEPLPKQLGDGQ